jgi:hypothetical protein
MVFKTASLANLKTARRVFRQVSKSPRLQLQIFITIATKPALRREILAVLKKNPKVLTKITVQLATVSSLRRKLLKVAGQQVR